MLQRLRRRVGQSRERFRRNLENLVAELDANEWDRVVTSKASPRVSKSREDIDHDMRELGRVIERSTNEVKRSNRHSSKTKAVVDRMCSEYGVDVEMPRAMPDLYAISGEDDLREFAESEEGVVGTPHFSGRLTKEPSSKYMPATVRGTGGNAGLYETYWSSESQIYDAVQGHTELLASGVWAVQMPDSWPVGQKTALEDFVQYHNARMMGLRCQRGRWATFVEHAATAIPIGFSLFEPIFKTDSKGRYYWAKAGFREQSTVWRWWMNERADDLTGVQFQTGAGSNKSRYELEATDDPRTNHVLWFGIGAIGANWEGRPPTRPSLHWVKMKRLIAQIVPLAAEKYGVPIAYLRADPEYLKALVDGAGLVEPDLDDAYEKFKDARAAEGPVFKFADGIIADVVSPPGEMPSLNEWIQYADQMISFPFSNEGNLLGMHSATGSYAQAEVKERRFLRSAPAYARKVSEPVNTHVLEPLARMEFGDEMIETPKLVYRPHSLMESGSWIENARQLFGPNLPVDKWPEEFRKIAYEKMGTRYTGADLEDDATPLERMPEIDPQQDAA